MFSFIRVGMVAVSLHSDGNPKTLPFQSSATPGLLRKVMSGLCDGTASVQQRLGHGELTLGYRNIDNYYRKESAMSWS